MIAMDLSASMWAEDVKPNRLTQAKRELSVLINRWKGIGWDWWRSRGQPFCSAR
jgi:hypothetical protein